MDRMFVWFVCVLFFQCPEGGKGEKGEKGEPVSVCSCEINGLFERFCLSRRIYLDPVSTLGFNCSLFTYFLGSVWKLGGSFRN